MVYMIPSQVERFKTAPAPTPLRREADHRRLLGFSLPPCDLAARCGQRAGSCNGGSVATRVFTARVTYSGRSSWRICGGMRGRVDLTRLFSRRERASLKDMAMVRSGARSSKVGLNSRFCGVSIRTRLRFCGCHLSVTDGKSVVLWRMRLVQIWTGQSFSRSSSRRQPLLPSLSSCNGFLRTLQRRAGPRQ
jgi:hypothetical protein